MFQLALSNTLLLFSFQRCLQKMYRYRYSRRICAHRCGKGLRDLALLLDRFFCPTLIVSIIHYGVDVPAFSMRSSVWLPLSAPTGITIRPPGFS